MEKIVFTAPETGEEVEFYVVEETRINGVNYLLVTESDKEEEDAKAYILKDMSKEEETEAVYKIIDDDEELEAVSRVFAEQLDDMYWMLVQQIAGEQLPAKEADIESKLRSLLISMGFDLKVRAMLEYDLPAVDIMAGQADDKIVSPGSELMQYFSQ